MFLSYRAVYWFEVIAIHGVECVCVCLCLYVCVSEPAECTLI